MSLAVSMESMQDLKVSLKMDLHGTIAFDMKPTTSLLSTSSSHFTPSLRGMTLHFQSTSDGTGGLCLNVWLSAGSDAHLVTQEDTDAQSCVTAPTTSTESVPDSLSLPPSFLFPAQDYSAASHQPFDIDMSSMNWHTATEISGYSSTGVANETLDMVGVFSESDLCSIMRQSLSNPLLPASTSLSDSCGSEGQCQFMSHGWNEEEPPQFSSFIAEDSSVSLPVADPSAASTSLSVSSHTNESSPSGTDESQSPSSSASQSPSSPETQSSDSDASPRPYPCLHPGCDRWFTRRYTRTVHMGTHTRSENRARFACSVAGCTHRFSRKHDRLRHEVTQHGKSSEWRCDVCRLHFSSHSRLERHIRGKHSD